MQRIALIGAMQIEIQTYCKNLEHISKVHDGSFLFIEGELFGKNVIITSSGVGKVLASLTTQKVIDTYHPVAVIMTGVAGALKPELRLGDIVVSENCVQHDFDSIALGLPRGAIPDTNYRFIPADAELVSLALATKLDGHQVIKGHVLSGDQFFTEKETLERSYLFDELEGSAIEMEGAALALTCAVNKTPFVIIRTICSVLKGNQEEQFRETLLRVVDNPLQIVESILRQYQYRKVSAPS